MKKLLQLKHWQLFLAIMIVPILFQLVVMNSLATHGMRLFVIAFPVMMLLMSGILFGWFYSMGTQLYMLLPENVHMNLNRFKLFLLIPAGYIVCISFFMCGMMSGVIESFNPALLALIIPLHLFSIFGIFHSMYFNAKALKSIELQRPVNFNDFTGEFFLIWFFPVGIWIIQPRINKLLKK